MPAGDAHLDAARCTDRFRRSPNDIYVCRSLELPYLGCIDRPSNVGKSRLRFLELLNGHRGHSCRGVLELELSLDAVAIDKRIRHALERMGIRSLLAVQSAVLPVMLGRARPTAKVGTADEADQDEADDADIDDDDAGEVGAKSPSPLAGRASGWERDICVCAPTGSGKTLT